MACRACSCPPKPHSTGWWFSRCCRQNWPAASPSNASSARSRWRPSCSTRTSCHCCPPVMRTGCLGSPCRLSTGSRCAHGLVRGNCPSPTWCIRCATWPVRSRTRMAKAWCTATSNRRISCWPRVVPQSPTSAWRRRWSTRARNTDQRSRVLAWRSARRPTWRRNRLPATLALIIARISMRSVWSRTKCCADGIRLPDARRKPRWPRT